MHYKLSILLYIFALLSFITIYAVNYGNIQDFLVSDSHEHGYNVNPAHNVDTGSNINDTPDIIDTPDDTPVTTSNSRKLIPLKFTPLPLGSIRPTPGSWLEHELQNSATGLAGHLWDFYKYVKDSTWVGGDKRNGEYSQLREGFPYWFNGLVNLAYTLPNTGDDQNSGSITDTARLKAQVHQAAQQVLDAQGPDGWLGPEAPDATVRLLWGRFPLLLGLTSLVEANSSAWEEPVIPALWRFTKLACDMLANGGKGFLAQGPHDKVGKLNYSWGRVRVADFILTLHWLLEKNPQQEEEEMLWKCMDDSYNLSFKWEAWYNEATYIKDDLYRIPTAVAKPDYHYQHGVNVAQGLKAPAVIHRFTHNTSLLQTTSNGVEWTFKYHGAASGTVLADERLDGLSPYSGSELCTAVEAIVSLAYLYHALGKNDYADRTELVTFNALPSMMTSDHWAHQYVTQPNQPWSRSLKPSPFSNIGGESQTFGLEPNYPCCTVNHPQGLPKFVAGSWVKVGSNGLAHVLLSPGTVKVGGVVIECRTQYPFDETLEYTIYAEQAFPFYVRIPGWASEHKIAKDDDHMLELAPPDAETGLQKIEIDSGRTRILYTLNSEIKTETRANDTVAVHRGALLYALEVQHKAESSRPKSYKEKKVFPANYAPPQVQDFALTNTSAWNIAIDPSTIRFERRDDSHLADPIWASGAPPTFMSAQGCEIEWPLFKGVTPGAPLPLNQRKCLNSPVTVRLVPLGSALLHMVDLPTIDLGKNP